MTDPRPASDHDTLAAVLSRVAIFRQLAPEEIQRLADRAVIRTCGPDASLVLAGGRGDSMMVVLEGQVKIHLDSLEGREVILAHMGPGDFFGEMSLIDGAPRSASVRTVTDTRVAVIERRTFLDLAHASQDMLLKVAAALCQRLREADEKIADLAFRDVVGRLANYLIHLAQAEGEPETQGRSRVRIPSHRELASELGTVRETVSRAFAQLRKGGFIEGQDRCWLLDPHKLSRLL